MTIMAMNPATFPKAIAYGCRCQSEETATYAHKLQRLLQSLEHRVSFLIHCHAGIGLLEEQRKSFRKCDECDTASDGKHDGLLHILVSVL